MASGKTVLVVEDDDECRELTCEFIERLGYETVAVVSGVSALERLNFAQHDLMNTIDVILSDNMMPGLSGVPFLRKLREKGFSQPLIFCSSIFPSNISALQQELGIKVLLNKPYSMDSMRDALTKALNPDQD